MMSLVRSLALVLSNNKMIYEFGPDHTILLGLGGGHVMGVPNPLLVLAVIAVVMSYAYRWSAGASMSSRLAATRTRRPLPEFRSAQ